MITKIYRVKGTFVMGDEFHKFVKEYKATSEADIEEKIYELQQKKFDHLLRFANLKKPLLLY